MLFEPSVSRITTFDFAFEFFSRETALARPIPTAVPSLIRPRVMMSVRTPCSRFSSEVWSVVIGHCVKASPAKMVRPMLSFGRPEMNSAATFLAASMRFGFRSSASIEVETSIASIMSMPSVVRSLHELRVCGLASTMTSSTKASTRSSVGKWSIRIRRLLGAVR